MSPPVMPPGVAGFAESGLGASRVHSTNPSGRGAPEATPRLNGSAVQRGACACARAMMTGATVKPRQLAASPPISRRRQRLKRGELLAPGNIRKDIGNDLTNGGVMVPFDPNNVSRV